MQNETVKKNVDQFNIYLPQEFKDKLRELAKKEGISASELIRCWIKEKTATIS